MSDAYPNLDRAPVSVSSQWRRRGTCCESWFVSGIEELANVEFVVCDCYIRGMIDGPLEIRDMNHLEEAFELGLAPNWLNLGPVSLLDVGPPDGFLSRCRVERFEGLTVYVADRYDLIHMKLYAAVDQGPRSKHMSDLVALDPSPAELESARLWCCRQDVSEAFANEVVPAIEWIRRVGDE